MDYKNKYLKYKYKYFKLRKFLGGGIKEEAINEIKKLGFKSVESYGYSLRKSDGSYDGSAKKMGNFTIKLTGHPAQSASIYAKEGEDSQIPYWEKNSPWILLDSFGDH